MALRALKTEEEISAIPLDQEILIELPSAMSGMEDGGGEPAKPAPKNEADEAAQTLQEQLTALKAANDAAEARANTAARERDEARRAVSDRDVELRQARTQSVTAEESSVQTALAAAQDTLAAAEAELERAGQDGDFKAMAKASAKIGRAGADIRHLEMAAADVAQRKDDEAKRPEPKAAPAVTQDPMAAVDANPNLLPAEKEWLKAHPETVVDQARNNELGVGYQRAVAKGLARGTAAYFQYLEEFMGFAPAAKATTDERDISVQAPVSRNERGGDGRPSPNKITLTPEQREIARSLGVSEIEYARQVQALDVARKAEPDKYR